MKHHAEKTTETYFQLRDALRKLRGQGLFRGNEQYIAARNELRLPFENRGGKLDPREFVLHLGPEMDALWAERLPDHFRFAVRDVNGDWEEWLQRIVAACRGGDYLHTSSQSAEYRHRDSQQAASGISETHPGE